MLSGMSHPSGPSDDPNGPVRPPTTPHGTAYPGPGAYLGPNGGQAPPPHPQGYPQQGYPQQGYPQQGYGHPQQGYGDPYQQAYPPGYGYPPRVPMTPDGGAVLSGWWRRVGARIIDGLIITMAALPLSGYFLYKYIVAYWDVMERELGSGRSTIATEADWDVQKWVLPVLAINLVASFAYEYFFLTRSGATPGKKICDISVRLRDVPGPPPAAAVVKRWGLVAALGMVTNIPIVGSFLAFAALLNYLWPLWDTNRQAWHDKVAATNVVRGPQPPRNL
jgi:uncharacterized RDD family membrane protein YckC